MPINSTAIDVTWLPPAIPNGVIVNYSVAYRPTFSQSGLDVSSIMPDPLSTADNHTHIMLTNLLQATRYAITLTAYTIEGAGPMSSDSCMALTEQEGNC